MLLVADYARDGSDLVLTGADGSQVVIQDYFAQTEPPVLMTESGAIVSADLAAKLAGPLAPGEYSQAEGSLGACAVEVVMLGDWRAAAGEVGFWPECGHLARPTLGWKSQTGRPEGKRFAFHTRSMGTARPGASALAGQC